VAKMASSQPVHVIPELRINTNISMEVTSLSVNVSAVKRWHMFLRSLFCKIIYVRNFSSDRI
jgi:hypothetical protein